MTVLGRGLVFQMILATLPYAQTCTYNSDNIIALQSMLTLQISHQQSFFFFFKKKVKKKNNRTDVSMTDQTWSSVSRVGNTTTHFPHGNLARKPAP